MNYNVALRPLEASLLATEDRRSDRAVNIYDASPLQGALL